MRTRLPIIPGNTTPPALRTTSIERISLLPAGVGAWAWIEIAAITPRHWWGGFSTGLHTERVAYGRGIEHCGERWPNRHNAYAAQLVRIAEFWRRLPADAGHGDVRAWIEFLAREVTTWLMIF